MPQYDAVAYKGKLDETRQALIRPMTLEERASSRTRFDNPKKELTILVNNNPGCGGWPYTYAAGTPVWGYEAAIRNYRGAPEMLPKDFDWVPVEESEELDKNGAKKVLVWGGTLKDPARRL